MNDPLGLFEDDTQDDPLGLFGGSVKPEPTEKSMRTERVQQFYKDVGGGALETIGAVGSNMLLAPFAGIAGLANLGGGVDKAVEAIGSVYDKGYKPKTDVGKAGTENVSNVLNLPAEYGGKAGEAIAGNEGRLVGEIVGEFATDLLPFGALKRGKGKAKAPEAPTLDNIEKRLDAMVKRDPSNPAVGQMELFPDTLADTTGYASPYDASTVGTTERIASKRARRQQELQLDQRETLPVDAEGNVGNIDLGTQTAMEQQRIALERELDATQPIEGLKATEGEGGQQALFDIDESARMPNPTEAVTGDWRIDENGIPVKADLSMEAANLENAAQSNLWGDELPPKHEQELTNTSILDNFKNKPISNRGALNRQRGAIDTKAISDTYDALRRGVATRMDYFRAWKGAFDSRAMQEIESDLRDPKSRSTLVLMRPDSFHNLALKRDDMVDAPRLHKNIEQGLESEKGLREIPQLWTDTGSDGVAQVTGHEGRHRMDVFKKMGIDAVPVIIRDGGYRWGGTDPSAGVRPTKIRPEGGLGKGAKVLDFPAKTYHDYIQETPVVQDRTQKPIGQRGFANSQTGAIKLPFGKKPAVDQLKKIEGIKNDPQLRNIFPETLSVDEVIKEHAALKTPDVDQNGLQKLSNHLTKGSLYQAIKTNNPIVRVVGEKIRQATNRAFAATGELVHDKLAPLAQDMSAKEKADVWAVQQMAEAKGVELTPDFLREEGFNQKQIDWVTGHKAVMDEMYSRMSDSMTAAELKPVSARVAYVASRARGDFRRLVMKDKKVVGIMGDNTRGGLNKQIARLKKDHPEYTVGEERYYGGRAAKGTEEGFMQMLDFLSKDNPDFKLYVQHINDMLSQDAFQYMNAKSHTMQKKGVFGMEGRKMYLDAVKNAEEGMQAQIRYAETMIKWSELSKAIAELKPLLKQDNGLDMPNAKEWANEYIQGALGNSPGKLGNALDSVTAAIGKGTGIGTTIPARAVSAMKQYVNGTLLGFVNVGFLTANALQLPRTMPEMAAWLNTKGIEAGYDLGLGRALMSVQKQLTGGKMTDLEKGAFDYAKKNHVYSSNLFESGNTVSKGLSYYWQKGTQMIASPLERETRKVAFFAYTHMLDEAGIKPGDGLYEAAQNLTDMHMNNYAQAEAPRVYQETGGIGRSAYNLMSFKHNELSRLAMFAREIPNGQGKPILTAMASQVAFAGLIGTLGFAEADNMYEWLTAKMGEPTSLTKLLLDNPEIPDALKFGMGSLADVDLTNRMGLSLTPGSMMDLVAPGFSKLGDVAGAVGDMVSQPNTYNAANLAREALPLSVGGIMDRTFFETEDGMALNRNKVTASAVRNDADKLWKTLGMTGVNESVQKKLSYENQKIDQVYKDKRSKVIDGAIKEYYMRGELPDNWVERYVELQGDPKEAVSTIRERIELLNVDRPTKELMKNAAGKSVTTQHKLLRRLGME